MTLTRIPDGLARHRTRRTRETPRHLQNLNRIFTVSYLSIPCIPAISSIQIIDLLHIIHPSPTHISVINALDPFLQFSNYRSPLSKSSISITLIIDPNQFIYHQCTIHFYYTNHSPLDSEPTIDLTLSMNPHMSAKGAMHN